MKIVFLGSGTFTAPISEALQKEDGLSLSFRVDNNNAPDLMVVVNYGKLISKEILALPRHGVLNIHPSLLPELRGPSPIQYALREGREETGVSLMVMDEEFDHGPIISQKKMSIEPHDTYITLEPKLAELGAKMLVQDIRKYVSGELRGQEQDHRKATFTNKIEKEDGRINWDSSAQKIYNQWRAYVRWPGIFTYPDVGNRDKLRLNLIEISVTSIRGSQEAGVIFSKEKKLFVACGEGVIEVIKIQPEGKKIMLAYDFLNGYKYLLNKKASS